MEVENVAMVTDVANYILTKCGSMSAMKLQKLCYYSHAWHLVWEEQPLFSEPIEAWANGPVVYDLYLQHRGRFTLHPGDVKGDSEALSPGERSTIDAVIEHYNKFSAHQLSELTHLEAPWRDARAGLRPGQRGNAKITDAAMAEYYDGLTSADDAQ